MKPLIIGESNPYGALEYFAMYPIPRGSAGQRMCDLILQMTCNEYLNSFDRINLCRVGWSRREARETARDCMDRTAILCGAKVSQAFGYQFVPLATNGKHLIIPHPSGLNRMWGIPGTLEKVRDAVDEFLRNATVHVFPSGGVIHPRKETALGFDLGCDKL